jgi:hypothetical protein
VPAEVDQLFDGPRIAFEDRLDRSLRRVAHPARDARGLSPAPDAVPEEDSLDAASDDDPLAGQGLLLVVLVLGRHADTRAAEDLG